MLADQESLGLEVSRGGIELSLQLEREGGEPLGMEVDAALFDRVRTCDNHCEFCFIHQLPKGMRKSLYVRDDDYRLSFLYGNFTTLTRFTEADLERVLTEGLSPLFVSIHATDPEVRARMLRNRRGASSLRWLRALLDGGVEVHGQVVVCPGVNDGDVLEGTLAGVLDEYPELASVACVPLGREPLQPGVGHAAPHAGRSGRRHRPGRGMAGAFTPRVSAGGSCTRLTSTTCWPAARSHRSRRTGRWPSTTTASAWPGAFEAAFAGRYGA